MLRKISLFIIFAFVSFSYASELAVNSENHAVQGNEITISEKIKNEVEKIRQVRASHKWQKHEGNQLPEYEKLIFSVMWQFIPVGEASLELRGIDEIDGRQAHHIYSYAKSNSFFDEVFKVRDVNEAWIDKESMVSLQFISNISEGGWTKREELYFNHAQKTFLLYDSGKMQKGTIPENIQDVLTALYYMRTIDIKVGQEYTFSAHSGDLSWPLVVKVLKKEKKKTNAGTFKCFVVEPLVRKQAGIVNAEGKMQVWITADSKKMPVYLKAKIPIGAVNASLEEIENGIPK